MLVENSININFNIYYYIYIKMTTEKTLLKKIKDNNVSLEQAKQIQYEPMDDTDIRYYFPDARIVSYSELSNYETIDDLLPKDLDYVFLLYEEKPNYGHWVLLSKYNDLIEYFDSYGGSIDEPLSWVPLEQRKIIGVGKPYLTNFLKNTNDNDYGLIYNAYDFQDETDNKISTCGRWCCLRLKTILNNRMPLITFINMMKDIKKKSKLRYDVIVSDLINKY
jgi:hypothetical protein